ncbi:MAG: dihydrodipicolinate synthase family protein, partial [Phycisphaerae bacterium]|nr:dihydrodipicolinate synthase family protein [Phycisphaerae bacterium]
MKHLEPMQRDDWSGVFPAITTPWQGDDTIDVPLFARHAAWMMQHGCRGLVTPGSLGEGGVLTLDEKRALWTAAVQALGDAAPVVAAVGACSTRETVQIAHAAAECGCRGLMVLPPYAYVPQWREARAHFCAIFQATGLSCMLYNNPLAYGADVLPEQLEELCDLHANLHAVKESSGDIRRFAAIRHRLGERVAL